MFTVAKKFTFSASHRLELPEKHPCSRVHGHNYTVWLELEANQLDSRGMVLDFGELRLFKQWLDGEFDHHHLNDVVNFSPTCENLAEFFYTAAKAVWPELVAVRVSEGETTWAEYRP
jgi:6-pyruvoyltetrahydropterin/6-carboxytetrahydropterin synthase